MDGALEAGTERFDLPRRQQRPANCSKGAAHNLYCVICSKSATLLRKILKDQKPSKRPQIRATAVFHRAKRVKKDAFLEPRPAPFLGRKSAPQTGTGASFVIKTWAGKRPQNENTKTAFWNPVGARPGANVVAVASRSTGQYRSIRGGIDAPESGLSKNCPQP